MGNGATPFDEAEYRQQLISGGIDAATAADVARRTAVARDCSAGKPAPRPRKARADTNTVDLFSQPDSTPIPDPADTLGDLPPSPSRRRKAAVLETAGVEIRSEKPSGDDMAFMHAIMCHVGLPRSSVAGAEFERSCGSSSLRITAGRLWNGREWVEQCIPYGALPRLILVWMNSFAVRNRTPEIPVGNSASEFLRLLGRDTSGGAKGSFTMLRKQMNALAACRLTLGFVKAGKASTYDGTPITRFDAWLSNSDPTQPSLWPETIVYSADYYDTLVQHAVPLDLRAYLALKGSALELDMYAWMAQRLHRIEGRPVMMHWANAREQFGQEYRGKDPDKDFKKKFLLALNRVLAVYPQAKIKVVTGGILLMPSPPPIPFRGA